MAKKLFVVVFLQFLNGSLMKSIEDLPIKYPGPTKVVTQRPATQIPEECESLNYCTIKPPDYPQEEFDKMLLGSKLLKYPNLLTSTGTEVPETVEVGNRQGEPGEYDDCRASVSYDILYKVRDKKNGEWRTVVNSAKEYFVQRVRMEICLTPGEKCFKSFIEPVGFETFCKQENSDWDIVVSDGKNGTETITAALPVCCSCFYRSVDVASRFGKPKN